MEDTQSGTAMVEGRPHPSPLPSTGSGQRPEREGTGGSGQPASLGTEAAGAAPRAEGERPAPDVDLEALIVRVATAEATLRQAMDERDAVTAALDQERAARAEAESALQAAQAAREAVVQQLAAGAGRYRAAVLAAAPEVPPELVVGETVDAIDRSLGVARETVAAVRRQLAERSAVERVPAGAPARGGPDLAALSAREKIALALGAGR